MNVKMVYFPVEIELFLNLATWVELRRTFLVAARACWFGILLLELDEFGRNLDFSSVHSWPIPSHFLFSRLTVRLSQSVFTFRSSVSQFKSSGQALEEQAARRLVSLETGIFEVIF